MMHIHMHMHTNAPQEKMALLEQHADTSGAESDRGLVAGAMPSGGSSSLVAGSSHSLPGVSCELSSKADVSSPKRQGPMRSRDCLHQWLFAGLEVSEQDTLLILKMLLKCSDISNVCKGRDYCLAWTDRVVTEFFKQVETQP